MIRNEHEEFPRCVLQGSTVADLKSRDKVQYKAQYWSVITSAPTLNQEMLELKETSLVFPG